ncbi:hypothetical protein LOTGIDRAFT_168451 [Lottia gigantea]|uniref:Uncharacterized protein n=1 Tax=Lottia gigantea TaxID=225164 RepID=V4B7Y0_LOTGI|nr:hypothetical protein LOTGIDRAFT_168451 [Lottia gigantea]ESO84779.1 hypothetical protein LOTGIDRAFT_168451 [Lottia gigantea]
MADAKLKSAKVDQATPRNIRQTSVQKAHDRPAHELSPSPSPSEASTAKKGSKSRSKASGKNPEKSAKPISPDNVTNIDQPSTSQVKGDNSHLSTVLLTEIKSLCSSVGDMKNSIVNSISSLGNQIASNQQRSYESDFSYDEDDVSDSVHAGQFRTVNNTDVDPVIKLIDTVLDEKSQGSSLDLNNAPVEKIATSDETDDVLSFLKSNLLMEETLGDNIDERLADIVSGSFTFKSSKNAADLIGDKIKKYKRPKNCPALQTQEINKLMWDSIPSDCRTNDCKMQRIQTGLVKTSTAVAETMNLILKSTNDLPKKLVSTLIEKLGDSIALNAHAFREAILRRKSFIQPHLKEEFKPLCAPSAPVSFTELLGEDLAKNMKDVSTASKLTQRVSRKSSRNIRNHPYNAPYERQRPRGPYSNNYNNNFSSNNRRPHAYQSFLSKGRYNNRPPEMNLNLKS